MLLDWQPISEMNMLDDSFLKAWDFVWTKFINKVKQIVISLLVIALFYNGHMWVFL